MLIIPILIRVEFNSWVSNFLYIRIILELSSKPAPFNLHFVFMTFFCKRVDIKPSISNSKFSVIWDLDFALSWKIQKLSSLEPFWPVIATWTDSCNVQQYNCKCKSAANYIYIRFTEGFMAYWKLNFLLKKFEFIDSNISKILRANLHINWASNFKSDYKKKVSILKRNLSYLLKYEIFLFFKCELLFLQRRKVRESQRLKISK